MDQTVRKHTRYDAVFDREDAGRRFSIRKGQIIAGYTVGIMLLDVWYPIIPGNVVNACTYDFPVRMRHVPGANQARMHSGDPTLLDALVETGLELQREGVRAICGACGYFAHFQKRLRAALDVPVFLSSLVQLPWIKAVIRPDQAIAVVCADEPSFTDALFENVGTDRRNVLVAQPPAGGEFDVFLHGTDGTFDNAALEREIVQTAVSMVQQHGNVGAILLECSDMPPYSAAVQRATGLPVFDFVTMIRYAHSVVAQRPYYGFI